MASEKANMRGVVVELLPNSEYRIEVEEGADKGSIVRCYLSGRLRLHRLRIVIGDRVTFFLPNKSSVGRVLHRL